MNTQEFFDIPTETLRSLYINRRIQETFGLKNEQRMREWITRQRRSSKPAINSRVWNWLNDEIQQPYVNILRNYADPIRPNSEFWKSFTHTPEVYAVITALMGSDSASLYPCAHFDPDFEYLGTDPSHVLACADQVVAFVTMSKGSPEPETRIEKVHPWTIVNALLATWQRGGPHADHARAFLCKSAALALHNTINRRTRTFDFVVAMTEEGSRAFQAQRVVVWHIENGSIEYVSYPHESFKERKILHADVPYHPLHGKTDGFWTKGNGLGDVLKLLQPSILQKPHYQLCYVREHIEDREKDNRTSGLLITPAEYVPPGIRGGSLILRSPLQETVGQAV